MSKKADATARKVLVHYFKIAVATDPLDSNVEEIKKQLGAYGGVTYLRSAMKSSGALTQED